MRFWNGLRQHRACTTRFVEYSAGQYPLTLAVCVPKKKSLSRAFESWGKTDGPMKQFPQNTSPKINWEQLLMSGLIVLCGFTSLQMCLLRKSSMPLHVKPASSVKSTRLISNGSSPHWRRNNWPILGVGENREDLEVVPVVNDTGTTAIHGASVTLLRAPHVWQLVFNGHRYRHSPPLVSAPAFTDQLFALRPSPLFNVAGRTKPVCMIRGSFVWKVCGFGSQRSG